LVSKLTTQKLFWIITGLLVYLLGPAGAAQAQDFPDVCQQPENILRNCTFDSGLEHWQPFTEAGSANFSVLQGGGECHAPLCPAAFIVVEDHFIGGLYQQVSVTPGQNYYANIVWLVFDSLSNDEAINRATGGIGRKIGIDPFGGTDPQSSNVIWSVDNWRNDCKICNIEYVTVTAQADTITLFLRLDDTWKVRAAEQGFPIPPAKDQFWLDDIGLKPVGEDVALSEAPTPTNTPPSPPTETPLPCPPTNTPAPTTGPADTATPAPQPATEVAQAGTPSAEAVSPEETPTVPPTFTSVPAPPTLTPTNTPSPTSTARPRPSPTSTRSRPATPVPVEANNLPLLLGAAGTTVCMGGVVLLIAALVLAGLAWLYKLGRGNPDDDDFMDDNWDDPPLRPEDDLLEEPDADSPDDTSDDS